MSRCSVWVARPFLETPNLSHRRWQVRSTRERKTTKIRAKNDEKSSENRPKIVRKSSQNRSWSGRGAPGRFGHARGRRRDALGTPTSAPGATQERSWDTPGRPKIARERSRIAREHSRSAPKTVRGRPGALVERVRVAARVSRRPRIDFGSFFRCRAGRPTSTKHWPQWDETHFGAISLRASSRSEKA